MPQIGVYALDRECVAFVANIANVLALINHVDIAQIAVRAVFSGFGRGIDEPLNPFGRLVERGVETRDLARFAGNCGQQIDVLAGFRARFLPDKPIQLVKFQNLVIRFKNFRRFF